MPKKHHTLSEKYALPSHLLHTLPYLSIIPVFAAYAQSQMTPQKNGRKKERKRAADAQKKMAMLTAKVAKTRVKQCQQNYDKWSKQMTLFKARISKELEELDALYCMGAHNSAFYMGLVTNESIAKLMKPETIGEYEHEVKEEMHKRLENLFDEHEGSCQELYIDAKTFYQDKVGELEALEKSLGKSRDTAKKTMENRWDVFGQVEGTEAWGILGIPAVLVSVLEFSDMRDLGKVMNTCTRLLHFVREKVPVHVTVKDIGSTPYFKWLQSFSCFRFIDLTADKNMKRHSLYTKLNTLAKSSCIEGLALFLPAEATQKSFDAFQKTFQKTQTKFKTLYVKGASVPMFLSAEQLRNLETLYVSDLITHDVYSTSWLKHLRDMHGLRSLTMSASENVFEETQLPGGFAMPPNVEVLNISHNWDEVRESTVAAIVGGQIFSKHLIVPQLQNCRNLKRLFLADVLDMTNLSHLAGNAPLDEIVVHINRNPLFGLGFDFVPTSSPTPLYPHLFNAKRVVLSLEHLPPISALSGVQNVTFSDNVSLPSILDCAEQLFDVQSVSIMSPNWASPLMQLEKVLLPRIQLILDPTLSKAVNPACVGRRFQFFHNRNMHCGWKKKLLHRLKYFMLMAAQHPERITSHGVPLKDAKDSWFGFETGTCPRCGHGCGLNRCSDSTGKMDWDHVRKIHKMRAEQTYREINKDRNAAEVMRAEDGSGDAEPPLKRRRVGEVEED